MNTFFTIKEPEHRWQNLHECHELYCAGHMMEAAAAYYEATGKDKLLHVMERMADHIIARFGIEEGKEPGIPGHEEIELGLLRMYQVTGKEAYLKQARYFIEQRGKDPEYFIKEQKKRGWYHWGPHAVDTEYGQCHATIYEQDKAVGHSVRAVYFYTAAAELASLYKDQPLFEACQRLWKNMTEKRMYITGGIISGMQLDGKNFFYVNPLETEPGVSGKLFGHKHVLPQRPGWYACACCPPNLVRMVTSLGRYLWSEDENGIYSHMYAGTEASLEHADVTVKTGYPWDGDVLYEVKAKTSQEFTFGIHIPGWIRPEELKVLVNGEEIDAQSMIQKGYLYLTRVWGDADQVRVSFTLRVRKLYASQNVREDAGCVALMRGPVVYCVEGADNDVLLQSIRIPKELKAETVWCEEGILKDNMLIKLQAEKLSDAACSLYSEEPPVREAIEITAIPYYTWGHRGENQMRVWLMEA